MIARAKCLLVNGLRDAPNLQRSQLRVSKSVILTTRKNSGVPPDEIPPREAKVPATTTAKRSARTVKSGAKKAVTRPVGAAKSTAKKTTKAATGKKTTAKKSPARKTTAKKTPARKTAATKAAKSPTRKTTTARATKKAPARRST